MNPIVKFAGRYGVRLLGAMLSLLPMQNKIIFESNPDFSCNTYPAFRQLKEDLPNYKMVWIVSGDGPKPETVDDIIFYDSLQIKKRIKSLYHLYTAKAIVYCNHPIRKVRPQQVGLFLCHGSKTKKTRGVYEVGKDIDYVNVQSHFFDDIITYEYNCGKEQLVYLGYPRCDCFYAEKPAGPKIRQLLNMAPDSRYLVWLPTFRKHKAHTAEYQMNTERFARTGMPLVYSQEDLERLNGFLAERNLYLVFKPHPAEDITGLRGAALSHIRIVSDRMLADLGTQLYEVLSGSDGLITDYSSVFFDYLLLDKPIVTTVDDMEQWKQMTGFAFDLDAFLDRATTRTGDLTQLLTALDAIHCGSDEKVEGRAEIRNITNTYFDGNSAKRVSAFVAEKIGERC